MPTLLIRVPTIIDFYLTAVSQFNVFILKGRSRDTSNVDVMIFSVCGGGGGGEGLGGWGSFGSRGASAVLMCAHTYYVREIGRNVTQHSVDQILNCTKSIERIM